MKAVIQRIKKASVEINNKVYNKIGNGLLIYLAFTNGDSEELLEKFLKKIIKLRIFEDKNGKTNLSLSDIKNPEILLISQFTLYADLLGGNRPSFINAMNYNDAKLLYEKAIKLSNEMVPTKCGVFGADMKISSENIGPFTVILEMEE